MTPCHSHSPDALTPDQRLREIAAILALGVIRLRTPPPEKPRPGERVFHSTSAHPSAFIATPDIESEV